jgi:hypothetical protein
MTPLRDKRTVFRIAEPVVRLHQLIVFRREPELVAGRGHRVWESAADTVASKIYGRHFEDLARSPQMVLRACQRRHSGRFGKQGAAALALFTKRI